LKIEELVDESQKATGILGGHIEVLVAGLLARFFFEWIQYQRKGCPQLVGHVLEEGGFLLV